VVFVLALGTFLMLTTEFVVAGILPEVAEDLGVSLATAAHLITVFAIGMIIGAPVMTVVARRLSKRLTLVLAMVVFAVGHAACGAPSSTSSPRCAPRDPVRS
jgi:DHA1 family inner membrane transport protein